MPQLNHHDLIEHAKKVLHPRHLYMDNSAGGVACAFQTVSGNIYCAVCFDIGSGIGFCAEYTAIAAMITSAESATGESSLKAVQSNSTTLITFLPDLLIEAPLNDVDA